MLPHVLQLPGVLLWTSLIRQRRMAVPRGGQVIGNVEPQKAQLS